jgi:hypothetical protein
MTLLDGIRCNITLIKGAGNKLQRENVKYPSVVSYKNSNCRSAARTTDVCHFQRRCLAYRTSSVDDYVGHLRTRTNVT